MFLFYAYRLSVSHMVFFFTLVTLLLLQCQLSNAGKYFKNSVELTSPGICKVCEIFTRRNKECNATHYRTETKTVGPSTREK